jgi:DegV family protein with EDD domain
MQIVTDSGMDLYLPPDQMPKIKLHVAPLTITLQGKSYRSGEDIKPQELYRMLAETGAFPTTSQPAAGDFAAIYRQLAATDPDILSIHMSSGLSGTVNAAKAAVEMVPEANITIVDTKTLSAGTGWQVEAAARALEAGWSKEQIVDLTGRVADASETIFTLDDLKYLIHGGRISHMKGLLASVLQIKPMIGVAKPSGAYEQLGQARTFKRAVAGLVDVMMRRHAPGSALRVQIVQADNPEGTAMLREQIEGRYECTWLPEGILSPVLGAHTGPSMIGVVYAALADYPQVP